MSLKAFHIFFIATSVLLAVGFGVWEFAAYLRTENAWQLVIAVASVLVAVGLVVYGIRFMRRLKHVGGYL